MSLNLSRVRDLSAAVLRTHNPEFRVVGVASSYGDGDRVELLVRIATCHEPEACLSMVNVGRGSEASFATELPLALRAALDGIDRLRQ